MGGIILPTTMAQLASETSVAYERRLERAQVPAPQRPDYHRWIRFYLDFCRRHEHPPRALTSVGPFLSKLAAKNQSVEQRHQAAHAIKLLLASAAEASPSLPVRTAGRSTPPKAGRNQPVTPRPRLAPPRPIAPAQAQPPPAPPRASLAARIGSALATAPVPGRGASWEQKYRDLEGSIKLRNYSGKTFAAYRLWVGKFQAFVHSRPTDQLGVDEPP